MPVLFRQHRSLSRGLGTGGRGAAGRYPALHGCRALDPIQRTQAVGLAPSMAIHALFSTLVYASALQRGDPGDFNSQLIKECRQLRQDDAAGRRWSARNYPGGYTSYGSAHRLQAVSPTFEALRRKLKRHVAAFAAAAEWNLEDRSLEMTDCWVNIMGRHTVHGLHLHPHATLSGTYYAQVPKGSPGTKFEDPRLDRFMAAPPRKFNAKREAQ